MTVTDIIKTINDRFKNNNAIFTIIENDLVTKRFFVFVPANDWGIEYVPDVVIIQEKLATYVIDYVTDIFKENGYTVLWNNTRNIFRIKEDN